MFYDLTVGASAVVSSKTHLKHWSATSNIKLHETSWLSVMSQDVTVLMGAYGDSWASV